jgi:hypothetical protein
MIDDELFTVLMIFLVIGIVSDTIMQKYGYSQLLDKLKIISVFFCVISFIFLFFFYLIELGFREQTKHKPLKVEKMEEKEEIKPDVKEKYETIKLPKTKKVEVPKIEQKETCIELDYNTYFYHKKDLDEDELEYLKNRKFVTKTFLNPFSNKKEKFVFKPRFNEGEMHGILCYLIEEFLLEKADYVEMFETVKPDIIFNIENKKYAVEVETGKILRKNRKRIHEKVKLLKDNYDDWFFVVTDKNFATQYRAFGKTFEKRYLKSQIEKFIEKASA